MAEFEERLPRCNWQPTGARFMGHVGTKEHYAQGQTSPHSQGPAWRRNVDNLAMLSFRGNRRVGSHFAEVARSRFSAI